MGIEYRHDKIELQLDVSDVTGDFIKSLDTTEDMILQTFLRLAMDCIVNNVMTERKRKESNDGLEGQNEGLGRW